MSMPFPPLPGNDGYVAARVLDFFGLASPWQRGLWCTGLVLTLKELLEASEAVHARVLHEEAFRYLAAEAVKLVGIDPGSGDRQQKRLIQKCLTKDLSYGGLDWLTLSKITEEIERHYLERWTLALKDATIPPSPERAARLIAAHLLDAGFSPEFLSRWWTYNIRRKGHDPIAKLVAAAHGLACEQPQAYKVLIVFAGIPHSRSSMPTNWADARSVSQWLRNNGFDPRGLSQDGGVWLDVNARDPWAAVESAMEVVDRVAARVAVGTNSQLTPLSRAWIEGQRRPFQLGSRRRGVAVRALYLQDQLYSGHVSGIVDAAIELLAPLASSSPSAAAAGGWAAIEALLSGPGDSERVSAGDRMASLVACSYPRAELTALSYRIEELGGSLATRLGSCTSNRDRAKVLAEAICDGADPALRTCSDAAGLERMRELVRDPFPTLRDIEAEAAACFRRLYRHRNMVLHWGKTDAVGLRANVRTAAPLVGAGMDRVAHAWFVEKTRPLELAARARVHLETKTSGTAFVDLLAPSSPT
jgi:hypothetical protein